MKSGTRLSPNTPPLSILKWSHHECKEFAFEIPPKASFQLFAEALAIQKVYELKRKNIVITVRCTYLLADLGASSPSEVDLGIFNTAFGLVLLLESKMVEDSSAADLKAKLLPRIWAEVLETPGFVGRGNYAFLFARDPDLPIPLSLLTDSEIKFPGRSEFTGQMRVTGRTLGGADDFAHSLTESQLLTFLYETSRNSYEHAREDLEGRAIKGSRSIVFQRVTLLPGQPLAERSDLPSPARTYISNVISHFKPARLFFCITVTDVGPGLHNTLPGNPDEGEWERLNRAFQRGQSRKPRGSEVNRGEGLPLVIDALASWSASRAFMYVQSANLLGYRDFSRGDEESPFQLEQWPHPKGELPEKRISPSLGTTVALLWPYTRQSYDQKLLFPNPI